MIISEDKNNVFLPISSQSKNTKGTKLISVLRETFVHFVVKYVMDDFLLQPTRLPSQPQYTLDVDAIFGPYPPQNL